MESCQIALQGFASFKFIQSIKKTSVEGERQILMTLITVSTIKKKRRKKIIFKTHTFNLATILDKLTVIKAGCSEGLVKQLRGQRAPQF